MGTPMSSDCCDCAPLRWDATLEGFGNDDAPLSVALAGVAAKVRLLAPGSTVDPTSWFFVAQPDGSFAAIPFGLFGGVATPGVGADGALNGNLDVWQAGDGPFTADGYTADGWQQTKGSGATSSITKTAQAAGAWPKRRFYAAWNRTVAGSTPSKVFNTVEDVRSMAGLTVTATWVLDTATAMNVIPYVEQNFGAAGSTAVVTTGDPFAVGAGTAEFSCTFEVPDVAGKTIGGDEDSTLRFGLSRGAAEPNGILNIYGFRFAVGDTAVDMPYEDHASVLARCQRYYQSMNLSTFSGQAYSTTAVRVSRTLPVTMRRTPLVTPPAVLTNTVNQVGTGFVTPTAVGTSTLDADSIRLNFTGLTGLTVGQPVEGGDGVVILDARTI